MMGLMRDQFAPSHLPPRTEPCTRTDSGVPKLQECGVARSHLAGIAADMDAQVPPNIGRIPHAYHASALPPRAHTYLVVKHPQPAAQTNSSHARQIAALRLQH